MKPELQKNEEGILKIAAETKHAKKDFSTLLSIMMDISAAELNIDELLPKIIYHATILCDGDAGSIFLVDQKAKKISKVYQYNMPEEIAKIEIPYGCGAYFEAIEKKHAVIVNDYETYPHRIEEFKKAGIKAVLVAPIIRKDKILGSISILNLEPGKHFMNYHAEMLEAIAAQAATSIEHASLFDELKKYSEELTERGKNLQALLNVALDITSGLKLDELMYKIAKNATELTGVDVGAVGLVDEEKEIVKYPFIYNLPEVLREVDVPFTGGLTGIVLSQRKSIVIEDYQKLPQKLPIFAEAGLHSIAMVPLQVRSRIIGILWVSSKNPEHKMNENDLAILEGLGRHAAIALENARLFEETQRKTEELAILNNLSNVISSTLELDDLLTKSIESMIELLDADGAGIYFINLEQQIVELVASKGLTPEIIEESKRIEIGQRALGIVADTGEPLIIPDLTQAPNLETPVVYSTFKSLLAAPIKSKGKIIGVIGLGSSRLKNFEKSDADLLVSIGNELGVAIENSRLYEAQRLISEALQRSMLPSKIPPIPLADIGVIYRSATEEAKVGGDFYDIFETNGRIALIIGDVSGKGIEAASSTSMIKHAIRAYMYQNPDPAEVLTQANNFVMRQIESGVFITVFCSVYDPDTGKFSFVNAGHPYPCILNQQNKTCTVLATNDPAIGFMENYQFNERTIDIYPGNLFVAYTDGVIEARRDMEFYGEKRLVETLIKNMDLPAQQIADAIISDCFEFSRGKLLDDIAILVVRRVL